MDRDPHIVGVFFLCLYILIQFGSKKYKKLYNSDTKK